MNNVKLPIGESDFRTIREEGLFYIDKSALIEELYKNSGTCAFAFTRPRRFGKTLAMSMLSSFFDIREDSRAVFDGLYISGKKEICDEWMNKFPTVFVSFKNVDGLDFKSAVQTFSFTMMRLYDRYCFLEESDKISKGDKISFKDIHSDKASYFDLMNSLSLLLCLLYEHYGKKVILLIDEYDVPLAKAGENGYYPEMLDMMTDIFHVLKDNKYLEMGVLTGCLRIRNESIISGLNNLRYNTVISNAFSSHFGFTSLEVENTFKELGVEDKLHLVKEWYYGYRFGKSEIYSPWDVMLYLNDLKDNSSAKPKKYWANTSGNAVVSSFVGKGDTRLLKDLDTLLSGGYVIKKVDEKNFTYDYLHSTDENLWSILLMTGYLTPVKDEELRYPLSKGKIGMKIPNKEVKTIYYSSLREWVRQESRKEDLSDLEDALWNGETQIIERDITKIINRTFSYIDIWQEYANHLFFTGLFTGIGYIIIDPKEEYGMGNSDIVVLDYSRKRAAIFEMRDENRAIDEAVSQFARKKYIERLYGYSFFITYGVKFTGKSAKVVLKDRIEL